MMSDLNDAILLIGPDESNDSKVIGTGFVFWVGESMTYILSCRHVVKEIQSSAKEKIVMAKNIILEEVIPNAPSIYDISVLNANKKFDCVPLCLNKDDPVRVKEDVYCIGFFQVAGEELHADALNLTNTVHGIIVDEPKRRQVSKEEHSPLVIVFEMDGDVIHEDGFSGAPLLKKADNCVVGIVTHKKGNKGFAVSIQEVWNVWPDISARIGQESASSENLYEVENSLTQVVKNVNEILDMVAVIPSRYSKPDKISLLRKQIQEDISILEDCESTIKVRCQKDTNRKERISEDIQVTIDLIEFLLELFRNAISQSSKNQDIQNSIIKEIRKLSLEYFINIQAEEANMDDDKTPFLVARLLHIFDPLKQVQIDVNAWKEQLPDFDIFDLMNIENIFPAFQQLADSSNELIEIIESPVFLGTFPRMSYQKHNVSIDLFNIEELSQEVINLYKKLQEDFLSEEIKGLIASCFEELGDYLTNTLHWLKQIIHWLDTSELTFSI